MLIPGTHATVNTPEPTTQHHYNGFFNLQNHNISQPFAYVERCSLGCQRRGVL
jgi:hypothetical protein